MRLFILLYTAALTVAMPALSFQDRWQPLTSVEQVCELQADRMHALMQALDLTLPPLTKVRTAVDSGDLVSACNALLHYYQNGPSGSWLRHPFVAAGTDRDNKADSICHDIYTFYKQTAQVPRQQNHMMDWAFRGPANDQEWAWALNRHFHFTELLQAFYRTGNTDYVQALNEQLQDWIAQSQPYPAQPSRTAMWRGLEVHFRVKQWSALFYGLLNSDAFTPATRLLLLSSIPDHAHYLRHFHAGDNWATMEMAGLATAAAAWPEFKEAPEWLDYARQTLNNEISWQVYPDGAQTELSSHYHHVALVNFSQLATLCEHAGAELPSSYQQQLLNMWSYLAYTMRPDGYGLLNNDSDLDYNRPIVEKAAGRYNRPDWLYIASNGEQGTAPAEGPSVLFPWAGQFIMRSGYDAKDQWAFFDMGPWGTGHQHSDKLHLSIWAHGRDLLVDAGRFAYLGRLAEKFRNSYAVHSLGHNVICLDGKGQAPGPKRTDHPLPESQYALTKDFDFSREACDHFDGVEGRACHTRAVFYVRGSFWIVVDRIDTDRPRQVQALWHWHPRCTVERYRTRVRSVDKELGNLEIVPLGDVPWAVSLVRGQEEPTVQGWYSESYNKAEKSTAAVYSSRIKGSKNFVWLLLPGRGTIKTLKAHVDSQTDEQVTVLVEAANHHVFRITVPLSGTQQPQLLHR